MIEHVGIEVSPYSVPVKVYEKYRDRIKKMAEEGGRGYDVFNIINSIYLELREYGDTLNLYGELTIAKASDKRKIERWMINYERFMSTEEEDWVWSVQKRWYKGERVPVLVVQPIKATRIAENLLWWRSDKVIISSATILDPRRFIEETGMLSHYKMDEILFLKVPSTFPPENRPIIDLAPCKLTREERDQCIPLVVRELEKIIERHRDENILVHAHSYEIAEKITGYLAGKYGSKIVTHTSENRKDALFEFKAGRGKVFVSVAFEEGIDLPYDQCRVQVLVKTPYPDISDRRVAIRLNRGEYNWYYLEAIKKTIQAYGRAVRAPDDKAVFYVLDESFRWLCKRTWQWLPKWFKEVLPTTCIPKYETKKSVPETK